MPIKKKKIYHPTKEQPHSWASLVLNSFKISMLIVSLYKADPMNYKMLKKKLWLHKAHVQAPVSGSMILAGIMLKLGGYGLLRVLLFCSDDVLERLIKIMYELVLD